MADALASGASVRKDVGVQVPPRAPNVVFNVPCTPLPQILVKPNIGDLMFEEVKNLLIDQLRKSMHIRRTAL